MIILSKDIAIGANFKFNLLKVKFNHDSPAKPGSLKKKKKRGVRKHLNSRILSMSGSVSTN